MCSSQQHDHHMAGCSANGSTQHANEVSFQHQCRSLQRWGRHATRLHSIGGLCSLLCEVRASDLDRRNTHEIELAARKGCLLYQTNQTVLSHQDIGTGSISKPGRIQPHDRCTGQQMESRNLAAHPAMACPPLLL